MTKEAEILAALRKMRNAFTDAMQNSVMTHDQVSQLHGRFFDAYAEAKRLTGVMELSVTTRDDSRDK